MVEITEEVHEVVITDEATGYSVNVYPEAESEVVISEEGLPGPQGPAPTYTDTQVKQDAEAGNSTPTYDETDPDNPFIVSMVYVDANGATNHSRAFNYTTFLGIPVSDSIVNTFTYEGQVWTYTKQLNWKDVGGLPVWDGTDLSVTKV